MKRILSAVCAAALAVGLALPAASALSTEQALKLLEQHYLGEIPQEAYEAGDLATLFQSLGDPYTYYMDGEEYRSFLDAVEKTVSLVGIGVSIQYTGEGILVVEPIKGGSAWDAGVQPGDLIVAVDGVSCVPASESHRELITGEEGTMVHIQVLREGRMLSFDLERRLVVIPNTETEVLDGHIGYIRCSSFGSKTGRLFGEGITEENDKVNCWLIDLRRNSGGLADAAVDCLGTLNGPGFYLYTGDKSGALQVFFGRNEDRTDHPVVVLTDEYSASASEAFAGGVRDLGLGALVGSRTFGKGIGQYVYDGDNMSGSFTDDALKITTFRFYSAGGVTNDQVGVIPTLLVAPEDAYDVARALCGRAEDAETYVQLLLNRQLYVVDPGHTEGDVLSALFSALPPDASLALCSGDTAQLVSPEECARLLGIDYESRWFTDVGESRFADAINALGTYGILHGDGSGAFRPGETLTRGELSAMVTKALNLRASGYNPFTDVEQTRWYAPYIRAAAAGGFLLGDGEGAFRPDDPVTREECWTVFARVARYLNVNVNYAAGELPMRDLELLEQLGFHSWSLENVALLDQMDGLQTTDGTPDGGKAILREEAAAALYSALTAAGILAY